MFKFDYSKTSIVNALRALGISEGDIVYSHVSLIHLGVMQAEHGSTDVIFDIVQAIKEVIGDKGTFITPSFTYSFCNEKKYDIEVTPSVVGAFGEYLRKLDLSSRSTDPIFSVTGFGASFNHLISQHTRTTFGDGCLYEKLLSVDAKLCNFGVDLFYCTPIHYLERRLGVSYRYDKTFSGILQTPNSKQQIDWEYYVRDINVASAPNLNQLQYYALQEGLATTVRMGRGTLSSVSLRDYFELAEQKMKRDPMFLTVGAKWLNS